MFLKKLDLLMQQRGINKNVLSKESGIPYTTIVGFYTKGYEKTKLSTLQSLAKYFGVTLDYLVGEDFDDCNIPNRLTYLENELIQCLRKLNIEALEKVLEFAQDLSASNRYKKTLSHSNGEYQI